MLILGLIFICTDLSDKILDFRILLRPNCLVLQNVQQFSATLNHLVNKSLLLIFIYSHA